MISVGRQITMVNPDVMCSFFNDDVGISHHISDGHVPDNDIAAAIHHQPNTFQTRAWQTLNGLIGFHIQKSGASNFSRHQNDRS
ncbi:hypothetical protein D3C71_1646990 [compost metagenome]